jgi:hypothetical protein
VETYNNVLVVFVLLIIIFVIVVSEVYAATLFVFLVVACHGRRIDLVLVVFCSRPARGITRGDVILIDLGRWVEVLLILLDVAAVAVGIHCCGTT